MWRSFVYCLYAIRTRFVFDEPYGEAISFHTAHKSLLFFTFESLDIKIILR